MISSFSVTNLKTNDNVDPKTYKIYRKISDLQICDPWGIIKLV